MPGLDDEPSLDEVLLVLADAELMWPARKLGISADRLSEYLREQAERLAPSGRPVPKIVLSKGMAETPPAPPPRAPAPAPRSPARAEDPPVAVGQHPVVEVFSDGAARGNPGPAGAGAVVRSPDGRVIARVGKFLGTQTNNVAEYEGLLIGVQKALDLGAKEVRIFADSLLVISQLRGEWKIKHPGLRPFYDRAKELLKKFDRVTLQHVRRELNTQADEMSNRAIDERM
jgi:ribonuclease HI